MARSTQPPEVPSEAKKPMHEQIEEFGMQMNTGCRHCRQAGRTPKLLYALTWYEADKDRPDWFLVCPYCDVEDDERKKTK